MSILTAGNTSSPTWNGAPQPADFFYLKGAVIAVLKRLGINTVNEKPTKLDFLSEGIALSSGAKIADLGVVKKKVAKNFGIEVTVHFANIYWDEVLKIVSKEYTPVTDIPKFPEVSRDFALLVDNAVNFKELREIALNSEKKILKSVQLFDVYEGSKLPKGKKSYALNFTLQDTNKTLTDKQIDKTMNKIQQQLESQAGAVLR